MSSSLRSTIASTPLSPQQAIALMVDRLVHTFHPAQIVLFGSQARGTATEASDIDLLVVFSSLDNKNDQAIALRRATSDIPYPREIIVATVDELARTKNQWWTLHYAALAEGKILYDATLE